VLVPEKHFVWTKVTQADLAQYDVTFDEVEGLIDVLRRTREAQVACVLKQAPDSTWRVSLRSLGRSTSGSSRNARAVAAIASPRASRATNRPRLLSPQILNAL